MLQAATTTTMPEPKPLLQIDGVTFAASDVLAVGPLCDEQCRLHPLTYQHSFRIRLHGGSFVKWRGERFMEDVTSGESEKDIRLKAINARNAVIQAAWPNGQIDLQAMAWISTLPTAV